MNLKPRSLFFICLMCLLLGGGAASEPAGNQTASAAGKIQEQKASLRKKLIEKINQERSRKNLPPLTIDRRLNEAAYLHSLDMAQKDFFSHEGSEGSTVALRIERQGYDWRFVAENLSCGHTDAALVVQEWMDSPVHRKNILHPQAEHIGIGIVAADRRKCSPYWTVDFASGE